jgi:hypothetical protein
MLQDMEAVNKWQILFIRMAVLTSTPKWRVICRVLLVLEDLGDEGFKFVDFLTDFGVSLISIIAPLA